MGNIIVVIILLIIVGLAVRSIVKAKKSGKHCIGCSDSCTCDGKCKRQ